MKYEWRSPCLGRCGKKCSSVGNSSRKFVLVCIASPLPVIAHDYYVSWTQNDHDELRPSSLWADFVHSCRLRNRESTTTSQHQTHVSSHVNTHLAGLWHHPGRGRRSTERCVLSRITAIIHSSPSTQRCPGRHDWPLLRRDGGGSLSSGPA